MNTSGSCTIGALPQALLQFVDLSSRSLGDAVLAISLFGSRSRIDANQLSDYDLFFLLRDQLDDEMILHLVLAAPESADLHLLTAAELGRRLRNIDVGCINILHDSRILFGIIPESLDSCAREAVEKAGLEPRPEIGKGIWIAKIGFPFHEPCRQLQRAEETFRESLSPRNEDDAISFEFVADQTLRALLAKRIQGIFTLIDPRFLNY